MSLNPDLVKKFKNARKIEDNADIEVREDEEQSVKLQEIIDILVAAGYFRARIKGLSSFDKVVGGMVWCIESCNVDLDIDLLFQENSSIGQKIALTEKIVAVLPKLKCPRIIEPHQIQGLDFINIYPVIQFLVKKSLECRQEVASFVRSIAVDQFDKKFGTVNKNDKHISLISNLNEVSDFYRPHRFYKRMNTGPSDIKSQLQMTLLEYGVNDGSLQEVDKQIHEEQKSGELNEDNINTLNKHYASLELELKDAGELIILDSIEEKLQLLTENCNELVNQQNEINLEITETKNVLEEIRNKQQAANEALQQLNQTEDVNSTKIKQIEELIILNDDLKAQEAQFKEHCKKELDALNKLIEETKASKLNSSQSSIQDLSDDIKQYKNKVHLLRIKLAKVNREVALLQRQLDDIPKRAELAQYQKRFVELYNQVAVKHKETKQYFTLYNTLEDTQFWMKKELSLLNSIIESYPEALVSFTSREEFLNQFQNIIDNVRASKIKAQQKFDKEKLVRDQLSSTLHSLVDQQRKYVAAVKQLGVECRKQELLLKAKEND